MLNRGMVFNQVLESTLGLYSLSGKICYGKISWSAEAVIFDDRIALKLRRHLNSAAANVPDKLQSDWKSMNTNRAASKLHEILR